MSLILLLLSSCATTHHDVPESTYTHNVKQFTTNLQEHGLIKTGLVVAAFATEPMDALLSGLRMNRGERRHFHEYGTNPTQLTQHQASKRPVLLLHGDKHNQSAFIPMLDYFHQKHYDGPIFTVNLPSVEDKALRHQVLDQKIEAIDALYKQRGVQPHAGEPHLRSCIIGHSWGADEAIELEDRDSTPRPLVLMGALKHSKRNQPQIYINATVDMILSLPSEIMDNIQPVGDVIQLKTGHLGLLSHPDSLETCYRVITSPDIQPFF